MERLKAALDKARAQRNAGLPQAPNARVAPGARSAPPAAARAPSSARTSAPNARTASQEATTAEWRAIPKLEIDAKRLTRRRLISLSRGTESTSFDVLRTKVLQMTAANNWRRIAITSPLPGSGKTTTSLNLAIALARQVDLRIILMDMDMRRPAIAKTLGVSGKFSVASVLEGREAFSTQARRHGENLAISMNYTGLRDPSDMFLRKRTSDVLDQIEQTYQPDLFLFDMPPMLVNDDTSAFLRNVDCGLMIVEADSSTVSQVDVCEKELAEQTNVLGLVLNKCRFHNDGYSHYYYKYD